MSDVRSNIDLSIEVSPDKLVACLIATPSAIARNWTSAELKQLCTGAGLTITPEFEQRLAALEDAKKRTAGTNRFEIAQGTPPIDARPATLLFTHAGGYVTKGQAVGQLEPARAACDGVDIFGSPITANPIAEQPPVIPTGLCVEGESVLTQCDGYFHTDGHLGQLEPVSVVEKFTATEHTIGLDRTTLVKGNIGKGVVIEAKRSLIVEGSVDSTIVAVAGDFTVEGIFGRALGRYAVGRNMRASFLKQANVTVGGNLSISTEIFESNITCSGSIFAPAADIRGGCVHAETGIDVNVVGNDMKVKTTLEIGIDHGFDALLNEKRNAIIQGRKHIERVRTLVAPLMANPKRLTGAQKEKATELLFEADELQAKIDADLKVLRHAQDAMAKRAESSLTVRSTLFAGTTIRFQGVETTIRSTLQGPCRVMVTNVGERPRIVAYLGTSTTPQILESRATTHNAFTEMRKLAA